MMSTIWLINTGWSLCLLISLLLENRSRYNEIKPKRAKYFRVSFSYWFVIIMWSILWFFVLRHVAVLYTIHMYYFQLYSSLWLFEINDSLRQILFLSIEAFFLNYPSGVLVMQNLVQSFLGSDLQISQIFYQSIDNISLASRAGLQTGSVKNDLRI